MARYGSDKPDLRFGLELTAVTDLAGETDFRVFQNVIAQGGIVKGLVAPGQAHYTGSDMRRLEETAKEFGAGGMSHLRLQGDGSLENLPDAHILLSPGLRMPADWSRRLATPNGGKTRRPDPADGWPGQPGQPLAQRHAELLGGTLGLD